MVMTLFDQAPVTPSGKPLKLAFEAPVVAYVIEVMAALMQLDWAFVPEADVNEIVLFVLETMMLPVKVTSQDPANVTV
jgi:hypothetical protein